MYNGHAKSALAFCQSMTEKYHELLKTADRKSTRLNSSHGYISYAVFCLKKKKKTKLHYEKCGMSPL